jgi:serine/threonine-protein kinase RsbW
MVCLREMWHEVNVPLALNLVFAAIPAGVPQARAAITELCERLGLDHEQADDIRLAVTEACTNCVLHSQRDTPGDATFVIDAHVSGDELVIVVRDFGGGILRAPAGSGGLGLGMQLIEQLSTSCEVSSRPGGGTRVEMHFDIAGDDAEMPAPVNSLELGEAEVQAVHGLQTGTNLIGADDPVWDVLRRLGLVQRKGADVPVWSLTMRGRRYRTH